MELEQEEDPERKQEREKRQRRTGKEATMELELPIDQLSSEIRPYIAPLARDPPDEADAPEALSVYTVSCKCFFQFSALAYFSSFIVQFDYNLNKPVHVPPHGGASSLISSTYSS